MSSPKIDARSAKAVANDLMVQLESRTLHPVTGQHYPSFEPWQEYQLNGTERVPLGRSAALVGVFVRFSEIVLERLNQVPDKNFLAYLDLLGAERQPPQSARVPLTFTLAAGSLTNAVVLAGTQVAAPAPLGSSEPVVFETELPLVVTAAQVASLVTLDPLQDSYGDWQERAEVLPEFPVFRGERALEHILYVGDAELLGQQRIERLTLHFDEQVAVPPPPEGLGTWQRWNGSEWEDLSAYSKPGPPPKPGDKHFEGFAPVPESLVNGQNNRWLRYRMAKPITVAAQPRAGMVRTSQLPRLSAASIEVHLERKAAQDGVAPELAFLNAAPLDASKDFLPFGEQPRLLDTLSLASSEVFSKGSASAEPNARVDLDVRVANEHLLPLAGTVRPSADLELAWECGVGDRWQRVGTSVAPWWLALLELEATVALRRTAAGTTVSATLQGTARGDAQVTSSLLVASGAQPAARPVLGGVGIDGRFADRFDTLDVGQHVIEVTANVAGRTNKAWAVVVNTAPTKAINFQTNAPSAPIDADQFALLVTLTGADAASVAKVQVSNGAANASGVLLPKVGPSNPQQPLVISLAPGRNPLLIEALSANDTRLAAATVMIARRAPAPAFNASTAFFSDGTCAFTQSGTIQLRLPEAVAKTVVNGQESYWLRARLVKGNYGSDANYVLKDPVKPEDGFILVPASFRPPVVATLKAGYDCTLEHAPERCLAFNQLEFRDCTAQLADIGGFVPFSAAGEGPRPGLFIGLTLPAAKTAFPNVAVSLYNLLAEPRYGEQTVPLSPLHSVRAAAAGAQIVHRLTLTNTAITSRSFQLQVLGQAWSTEPTAKSLAIAAGASVELNVVVTVPANALEGDSDIACVHMQIGEDPTLYMATLQTNAVTVLAAEAPKLSWRFWDGLRWSRLAVQDDTSNFTRSGLLQFVAPQSFAMRELFGRTRYWLRVDWDEGDYSVVPRLARVLLNTTVARQSVTLRNEVLGSSNGAERQRFRSTRAPVLSGQQLEVREPEQPAAEDRAVLKREEGDTAVSVQPPVRNRPAEIWVRWHEVPDFYASSARDRHYVINHLTGEIQFGDGLNGRIPPRGTGNVRLAQYRTGGGELGNSAAGTVAQLKSAVPYIEKASNPVAASGGTPAESVDSLIVRMPRTLRHGDRAVTVEDFEDLALLASTTELARARCVALRDLAADPLGETLRPGAVSVIVVPRTTGPKPQPTLDLLARTRQFLQARASATAAVIVTGPLYLRVDVRLEIAVTSAELASATERAVQERLEAFLHPLTGGLDGSGWDFGRTPHRSDFFALIEAIPGVDHLRYLEVLDVEDRPGVRYTDRFLVFSGEHRIDVVFETT